MTDLVKSRSISLHTPVRSTRLCPIQFLTSCNSLHTTHSARDSHNINATPKISTAHFPTYQLLQQLLRVPNSPCMPLTRAVHINTHTPRAQNEISVYHFPFTRLITYNQSSQPPCHHRHACKSSWDVITSYAPQFCNNAD